MLLVLSALSMNSSCNALMFRRCVVANVCTNIAGWVSFEVLDATSVGEGTNAFRLMALFAVFAVGPLDAYRAELAQRRKFLDELREATTVELYKSAKDKNSRLDASLIEVQDIVEEVLKEGGSLLSHYALAYGDLKMLTPIGEGAFGMVSRLLSPAEFPPHVLPPRAQSSGKDLILF